MEKLLTIAIPTYNRRDLLQEAVESVLSQAIVHQQECGIFISNNGSADDTAAYLESLRNEYDFIEVENLDRNYGYAYNQLNILLRPQSKYISILCDDDVYSADYLDTVLPVIRTGKASFLACNYWSFKKDSHVHEKNAYAPANDVWFDRPIKIANYPSVGHYSGFIFNKEVFYSEATLLAKSYQVESTEKIRGVFGLLMYTTLSKEKIPSLFIGKSIVGARMPENTDYDSIYHLILENYEVHKEYLERGIIDEEDFAHKLGLIKGWMLRIFLSAVANKDRDELRKIISKLKEYQLISPGRETAFKWFTYSPFKELISVTYFLKKKFD